MQSPKKKRVIAKVVKAKELHRLFSGRVLLAQSHPGLLEIEKDTASALVRDAAFGQGMDDLVETGEDVAERTHRRELWAQDVGAADGGIDTLAALMVAQVVIAEFFAEEGGGAAGSAVGLGELADAVRQRNLQRGWPVLVRQAAAKLVQAAANPAAKWDTPARKGGAQRVRVAERRRACKLRRYVAPVLW